MLLLSRKKEFKKFVNKQRAKRSFIENIFSLKNQVKGAIKYKAVTILGFTFLLKPKRKVVE